MEQSWNVHFVWVPHLQSVVFVIVKKEMEMNQLLFLKLFTLVKYCVHLKVAGNPVFSR